MLVIEEENELHKEFTKINAEVRLREKVEAANYLLQNLHSNSRYHHPAFSYGQMTIPFFAREYPTQCISMLSPSFYKIAGEWCSKLTMDHFAYHEDNLQHYLRGAFIAQNKDTIRHLFERVEDKDLLLKEMNQSICHNSENEEIVPFARWLLSEGLLQFTEEGWTELQGSCPVLYNALQADV